MVMLFISVWPVVWKTWKYRGIWQQSWKCQATDQKWRGKLLSRKLFTADFTYCNYTRV